MLEDTILQVKQIPLPAYTTPPVYVTWTGGVMHFLHKGVNKNRLLTHRVSRRFLCDFGNLSITYSYRRQPE